MFGQLLIEALDIGLNSFQVAGGIILFLFALTMIFGESKQVVEQHEAEEELERPSHRPNPAIFPLAVPSLASPGAMLAIVILTDNHRYSAADQGITALVMLSVMADFVHFDAAGRPDHPTDTLFGCRHHQPRHGYDPGFGRGEFRVVGDA